MLGSLKIRWGNNRHKKTTLGEAIKWVHVTEMVSAHTHDVF